MTWGLLLMAVVMTAAAASGCGDGSAKTATGSPTAERSSLGPATFITPPGLALVREDEFPSGYYTVCFSRAGVRACPSEPVSLMVTAVPPGMSWSLGIAPFRELGDDLAEVLKSLETTYGNSALYDVEVARAITVDGASGFEFRTTIGGSDVRGLAALRLPDGYRIVIDYTNRGSILTGPFDEVMNSLEFDP